MAEFLSFAAAFCQTFLACIGFCCIFNIGGKGAILCALGGALAWLVYLLTAPLVGNDLIQYFLAAVFLSMYSEIMARVRKCPVTPYMLVAFLPLVPGAGIYSTMECAINGDTDGFLSNGLHTLSIAAVLAVGVLVISSLVQMYNSIRHIRRAT